MRIQGPHACWFAGMPQQGFVQMQQQPGGGRGLAAPTPRPAGGGPAGTPLVQFGSLSQVVIWASPPLPLAHAPPFHV